MFRFPFNRLTNALRPGNDAVRIAVAAVSTALILAAGLMTRAVLPTECLQSVVRPAALTRLTRPAVPATVAAVQVSRSGRGRPPRVADRSEYEMWAVDPNFPHDVFTFVRIEYSSYGGRRRGWSNDYPDCDWNFSLRLQQLTSLQVDPNGRVLKLTDPELFDFPFAYMSNVQNMSLSDAECAALRAYLLNGGFVMADDFWAADAWRHVRAEMQRVFPEIEPRQLTIDHPIFHIVYNLKELPQVPSIFAWRDGQTVERWHGSFEGDESPHFQAYFDHSGRLMALFCHNNDIGDGWEREGENKEFFQRYSEKMSYPFGINLVTWVLTH